MIDTNLPFMWVYEITERQKIANLKKSFDFAELLLFEEYLSVKKVNDIKIYLTIDSSSKRIKVRGSIALDLIQECVVSLDDIVKTYDILVEREYLIQGESNKVKNMSKEEDNDRKYEDFDIISTNKLDLSELVCEYLVMNVDTFLRKDDAVFNYSNSENILTSEEDIFSSSPFSVLIKK